MAGDHFRQTIVHPAYYCDVGIGIHTPVTGPPAFLPHLLLVMQDFLSTLQYVRSNSAYCPNRCALRNCNR